MTAHASLVTTALAVVLLCGCHSPSARKAEIDAAFYAGQEAAFDSLAHSGIPVIRLIGPFQRNVILWHEDLTLATAFIEAGYHLEKAPGHILVQRNKDVLEVNASRLLAGNDLPLDPGVTIRVAP